CFDTTPLVSAEVTASGTTPPWLFPQPDLSQALLPFYSPLAAPPRYSSLPDSLSERREPASHASSLVSRISRARRVCPPLAPSTHNMALRPSSVPQPAAPLCSLGPPRATLPVP
ncbi:unnamed protein product, partial [Closterium sp. NIES-54]